MDDKKRRFRLRLTTGPTIEISEDDKEKVEESLHLVEARTCIVHSIRFGDGAMRHRVPVPTMIVLAHVVSIYEVIE
jgi:hypothetical protein